MSMSEGIQPLQGRDTTIEPDPAADPAQPESQGEEPLVAELGEDGEGDLGPSDL